VLDDGTGVVRTVFFGDQARKILEVDEETEKDGDQDAVEEAAEEIIGKELEVEGRTRYNDYFDQHEIIANSVEELDENKQIENLLELMEA